VVFFSGARGERMAIKLPEKTWFTFHELMERWQCTENDIRRLVIEESLIPSIRTSEKLTHPDWEFEPSGNFEPSGQLGENSSVGYALEFTVLNHWLYLRRPLRISTFDCQFRLATFGRDDPEPKDPYEVTAEGLFWHWIPEAMTLNDVIRNTAFLIEEVARFETQQGRQDLQKIPEKLLQTKERHTLLAIIAALCEDAGYDITKHSKTAGLIQSTAARMGLSIGETTIEGHLKKIPDALGARTK
jgi:hypothetical protein